VADFPGPRAVVPDRTGTAQHISTVTLELSQQARAAGLMALCYLLQTIALAAASDAAGRSKTAPEADKR